jgi:Cd(II)/Pb(II)-responsive transcriptional regulator
MTIGELAGAARCTVATVRYYEKEGLLPRSGRTGGNYRSFGPAHLERLRFIRNCRSLDLTHEEIRALIATMDRQGAGCGSINCLLDEHIEHVRGRIDELKLLETQLTALRERCRDEATVEDCGILQGLAEMEGDDRPVHRSHVG